MGILPIVIQQIAGFAFVYFFLITFPHSSLQYKGKIIIFMKMPVYAALRIVCIGQRDLCQADRLIRLTIKLASF